MFSKATVNAITAIAEREEIPVAALLAIAEVESAGSIFAKVNGANKPVIRWEGHYFHRLLPVDKRQRAIDAGLAHFKAGHVKNPRKQESRYALLEQAKEIDREAALQSCSWGLGQVMGSHWQSLGYVSVDALVKEASASAAGQVELMVRFIIKNSLVRYIRALDWAGFAKRYNGPNYAVNKYDTRMESAYERWQIKLGNVDSPVYELQKNLALLGYDPGVPDGVYGTKTTKAVIQLQTDHDLKIDGKANLITQDVIQELLAEKAAVVAKKSVVKERSKLGVTASVGAGAGASLLAVAPTIGESARELSGLIDTVKSMGLTETLGVTVAAAAVIAVVGTFLYRQFKVA